MSWTYSIGAVIDAPETTQGAGYAAAPEPQPFTPEEIKGLTDRFATLDPAHQQQLFADMQAKGIQGEQAVAGFLTDAFAGNDAMVQSPDNLASALQRGVVAAQHEAGRSTSDEASVALLASRVENLVKQMMSTPGISKEKVVEAAKGLAGGAGDLALVEYAADIADKQYDANKNPLDMKAEIKVATLSPEEEEARRQAEIARHRPVGVPGAHGPYASLLAGLNEGISLQVEDLGPTTAALAFNMPSPANVPDVRAKGPAVGAALA